MVSAASSDTSNEPSGIAINVTTSSYLSMYTDHYLAYLALLADYLH
ncbi:MAG: hypothetical protein WBC91_07550 [Phototrophicaceae bacterium]